MPSSPSDEYARRLATRESQVAHFERIHVRLGNVRLLLGIAAAIAAWFSLVRDAFSPWWLLVPLVAFLAIAIVHARVLRSQTHARRAARVYQDGLARIEDRWIGHGEFGERFDFPHHIYAADLDLFGRGSLFELLSRARTRMGETALANWLLAPSPLAEILERHAAVSELRDQLDLREDIAVLAEDTRIGVRPDALLTWAETPKQLTHFSLPLLAPLLPIFAVASIAIWWQWGFAAPLIAVVTIEALINYAFRKPLAQILDAAEHEFESLELVSATLARLEREHFTSPRLQSLASELRSHDLAASRAIARLRSIVQFIEARDNPVLRTFDTPLMYSFNLALRAQSWRRDHGSKVRSWLNLVGEFEALLSIAAYHYEHPADVFPEFLPLESPASFEADDLGHPLIPPAKLVRNSVRISGSTRVLLVSGSNMSGKSTFLRTVGINTVLAMAGAPVRAARLELTPLQTAASIRVNDSLHEGNSRFYAEITRLRDIYHLAGKQPPILFLLDELLQGTNSHDRRIGAEGIVRAFVQRHAVGLISTHDLALTEIGGLADGALLNFHFQDELADGKMRFDFKLREGVVTKSNGLELMRSIGLDV